MNGDVIFAGCQSICVPLDVIFKLKNPRALALYCILLAHSNETGSVDTSARKLAVEMGLSANSVKTVRDTLDVLEQFGLVKKYRRWCHNGDIDDISFKKTKEYNTQMSNLYAVFDMVGGAFRHE